MTQRAGLKLAKEVDVVGRVVPTIDPAPSSHRDIARRIGQCPRLIVVPVSFVILSTDAGPFSTSTLSSTSTGTEARWKNERPSRK